MNYDPIAPGESAREYKAFQKRTLATLSPVGALEEYFAERVIVDSWRIRRVPTFERGISAAPQDRDTEMAFRRLSRYEKMLRRSIDSSLKELRRLQKERLKVAPPSKPVLILLKTSKKQAKQEGSEPSPRPFLL